MPYIACRIALAILRSVEEVLHLELDGSSPPEMVDAFKIAFVVYAMGKVLTPSSKHDYLNVTFWGGLIQSKEIRNFNWAAHVLNALIVELGRPNLTL